LLQGKQAQAIELNIVHEDDQLLIIDKPPDLVVHPGAGNPDRTLLNALLHHDPKLVELPRAGIVHRLDKETSGLMVVARSLPAHTHLVSELHSRKVNRTYEAIVNGVMIAGGSVDAPIGRHPRQRTKMAVVEAGKEAVTHYRVLKRFRAHSHIQARLESGRTHQIRVHMAHLGFPLAGDRTYGGRLRLPQRAAPDLAHALKELRRQALHATRLSFTHPATRQPVHYTSELPPDIEALLGQLEKDLQNYAADSPTR